MKWLTCILSLYILFLAVDPCCLDEDCGRRAGITTGFNQCVDNPQEQGDDCAGVCSPFAQCGCTHGFSFVSAFFSATPKTTTVPEACTLYRHSYISGYSGNIWQPPKIA